MKGADRVPQPRATEPAQHQEWQRERRERVQGSKALAARSLTGSDRMRTEALAQRERMHEQRQRWEELRTGDARIERLWPHLDPPLEMAVRSHLPEGRSASVLLCGICDEVLATGIYAADLPVALRCFTCLGYNTGRPVR